MNLAAFDWGRAACADPADARGGLAPAPTPATPTEPSLEALVARRVEFLTAYQNAAYAERYRALVDAVAKAEAAKAPGRERARARPSRAIPSS